MIERGTGAGAGVCFNHSTFYKAVERDTTNVDDEIEAIFIALKQLSARKRKDLGGPHYSKPVIPDFSRPVIVAFLRLLTGHGCLKPIFLKFDYRTLQPDHNRSIRWCHPGLMTTSWQRVTPLKSELISIS
ncbi:hypothetical protein TNCV_4626731 [Trichonephila clavipes]|nr:hypothetical protein TNCV_4626731 [Trichonephila clavipes]